MTIKRNIMNIIKTICILCKEKNASGLSELLRSTLLMFITQSCPSDPALDAYLSNFSLYRPVLQIYPSTDVELTSQTSDPLLNNNSNALLVRSKPQPGISGVSLDEMSNFDFSVQEVRRLSKVFALLNSKKIKILILLLENQDLGVRKLALLFFQVLLFQSRAKVHFVEKCALGYVPGLYCLTRLKYLQLKGARGQDVALLLAKIKAHVKAIIAKLRLSSSNVRGRVPINLRLLLGLRVSVRF